jgi:hypothetical protein
VPALLSSLIDVPREDLSAVHRRGHRSHSGTAPAGPCLIRHPGAHHPGRLGHVNRSNPLPDHLVLLVLNLLRLLYSQAPPGLPRTCHQRNLPAVPLGGSERVAERRAAERQLRDLGRWRGVVSQCGYERGLRRRPAMPPSMGSAVPVTEAARGLAR